MTFALTGATVFDGTKRHEGAALLVEEGRIAGICAPADLPAGRPTEHVDGLLTPGLVDLQVNGGGGVMFNTAPTPETIATIAKAHARLGTTALLPTLITDTPEVTICAAAALQDALRMGVPGVIGLHLEGPHLSTARKGAHDGALIRPMQPPDCSALETLARDLPSLMLTVAPESTSLEQVSRLSAAGAIVSLGHTDTDFEAVQAAAQAGATCITHLFNAMSPFTSRAPGVVGAALETGSLHAGLIADGIHVHPATIRTALRAKRGPGRVFLVSDAMALTGSPDISFELRRAQNPARRRRSAPCGWHTCGRRSRHAERRSVHGVERRADHR